jgi:hypothetical protein
MTSEINSRKAHDANNEEALGPVCPPNKKALKK